MSDEVVELEDMMDIVEEWCLNQEMEEMGYDEEWHLWLDKLEREVANDL